MPPDVLLETLVRLVRLRGHAQGDDREELDACIRDLESVVGPTVGRARAARLLGITQTALDRWIDRGAIASVITPRGRKELPLRSFLKLLVETREARDHGVRRPVSAVLERRRTNAHDAVSAVVTPGARPGHGRPDAVSLVYHDLVARRLDEALVSDARARLARWAAAGTLDPRAVADWDAILQLPLPEIATILTSTHPGAADLRQNSPFAGALDELERRRIVSLVGAGSS